MVLCNNCKKQRACFKFYVSELTGFVCCCKNCISIYDKKYQEIYKAKAAKRKREYDKEYRKTIVGHLRSCFRGMKQRCNSLKYERYKDYGGRGIKCLFKSSDEFVDYVMDELKIDPRGLQIDRINNDGHYEKGNIRFVTPKENCNNRRIHI